MILQKAPIWRDPLFWALGIATLSVHLYLRLRDPGYWHWWVVMDEGYRLYPSLRMLRGEPLFGDMFTMYPPVSYFLHLWAYEFFGVKISSVRLVLVLTQTVTTLSTYAISRHLCSRGFSLFAALLTVLYGVVRLNLGYAGWYVGPFILLTLLMLFRYVASDCSRRSDLVLAGIFAGLCLATKLREGIVIIVASLVAILAIRILQDFRWGRGSAGRFHPLYAAYLLLPVLIAGTMWRDLDWPRALFYLAPCILLCGLLVVRQTLFCGGFQPRVGRLCGEVALFASGAAAVTLPWVLYYLRSVGWASFRYQLVEIPLWMGIHMPRPWFRGMQGADLPWTDIAAVLLLIAGGLLLGVAMALGRWDRILSRVVAGVLLTIPALPLLRTEIEVAGDFLLFPCASALALALVWRKWKKTEPEVLQLTILGVFCCLVPFSLHPWMDFYHWLWVTPPAFIMVGVAASHLYRYLAVHGGSLRWVVVTVACALVIALFPAELDPREPQGSKTLRGTANEGILLDDRSATTFQQVVDFVEENVPTEDYILEIPTSFFTFLTGRRQAAQLDYFFALDSTIWDEDREIEIIRRRNPRYAFLYNTGGNNSIVWLNRYPKIRRFLTKNYRLHRNLGMVTVWIRRHSE